MQRRLLFSKVCFCSDKTVEVKLRVLGPSPARKATSGVNACLLLQKQSWRGGCTPIPLSKSCLF